MRGGASDEMSSGLAGDAVEVMKQAPGIRRDNNGRSRRPSSTSSSICRSARRMTPANVPLRGIVPATQKVRYDARIVQGRMLEFGTNEIVAGRAAAATFAGLSVGAQVKTGQVTWTVVGIFESGGSVSETELWADARTVQGAFRRNNSFQSVLVRLESPAQFTTHEELADHQPAAERQRRRRVESTTASTRSNLTTLIRTVGFGIAVLMAVGAVFGAILTMYTAVSTRTREIATLRALGFNTTSVVDLGPGRIADPRRRSAASPAACSPTPPSTATRRRR